MTWTTIPPTAEEVHAQMRAWNGDEAPYMWRLIGSAIISIAPVSVDPERFGSYEPRIDLNDNGFEPFNPRWPMEFAPVLTPAEVASRGAAQREVCARAYLASILPAEAVEQELQRVRERVIGHSATAAAILDARVP